MDNMKYEYWKLYLFYHVNMQQFSFIIIQG